jgi:membrane-associated protease RseP (regulator of RpoE activity)
MLFRDRWVCRVGTFAGIAVLALVASAALGADSAPPVVLPRFNVIESVLNVSVLTEYAKMSIGPAYATRMTVDKVKTPSIAQRAGLKSGMEIIAIHGQRVAGLSQAAVEQLLDQPVRDSVVLLVRKSWWKHPEEIRLPVPPKEE